MLLVSLVFNVVQAELALVSANPWPRPVDSGFGALKLSYNFGRP